MDPRESDPTGAFSGSDRAGLDDGRDDGESARPTDSRSSATPGVDQTERDVITSATAATSEVADRDAQDGAKPKGVGTPRPG